MQINFIERSGKTIFELNGRLDTTNSSLFEIKFYDIFNKNQQDFVLDCTNLEYISSTGLRVMLTILKKMTAVERGLVLVGLKENVKEVFDISGFTPLFKIVETIDEAFA